MPIKPGVNVIQTADNRSFTKSFDTDSPVKKLIRLFRTGNTLKHHFQGSPGRTVPRGTAKAFFRNAYSFQSSVIPGYSCLPGHAKIATPNDERGYMTIEEMVERYENGEEIYVFSYDHAQEDVVVALISKAIQTKYDEIWKIKLDDDSILECTREHPIMLKDGTYRHAEDLKVGDAVMTTDRKTLAPYTKNNNKYRRIKNISKNKTRNWTGEHILVAETKEGRFMKSGEVVHHKDFNGLNNHPNNLEFMDWEKHRKYHADLIKYRREKYNYLGARDNTNRIGIKNSNSDKSFTIDTIIENWEPGISKKELLKKCKVYQGKFDARLKWAGYKNYKDFCKRCMKYDYTYSGGVRRPNRKLPILLDIIEQIEINGTDTPQYKIANNLGIAPETLASLIKRSGFSKWKEFISSDLQSYKKSCKKRLNIQDIYNVYKKGDSKRKIANKLKVWPKIIDDILAANGWKNWRKFVENYNNHKVVEVWSTKTYDYVYDLTVPIYHNFAVIVEEKILESGNIKETFLFVSNSYDRFARYSDYSEMESYPTISKGMQIFADEVTQKDEDGKIIDVISSDHEIEKLLTELLEHVLHLNGKEIFKLARNLVKYGDNFYLLDITEENGVLGLIQMPANEVEREEGFDAEEPGAIRFRWTSKQNIEIPNAYVVHFRLDGNDMFYPYGQSAVESARRPWRQLVLLEDAMLVYRLVRAPERRVFFLDIAGAPAEDVENIVNKFNETIRKHKVTNDKGQVDLRFGSALSMEEDYVIPVRGGDSATRIETLPGGQRIGDMEDIEFVKQKLFEALGIPKAFLTYDQDIGAKQVLTQEDIRFARTIAKIQEVIINELIKVCMIHLFIKGYRGKDLVNFRIKMTNPSTVAELQKNELWRARMDLVQVAGEGVFDTEFIYKNFLHLTADQIDKIRKGQILDKIFQAKLIALENSQGMAGMPPGGDMGLGGGMDMGLGAGGGLGGGKDMSLGAGEMVTPPAGAGMGEARNIWRTDSFRSKEIRGVGNIPGVDEDDPQFDRDPQDLEGIRRTISKPLGMKEELNYFIKQFNPIIEEYRTLSSCYNERMLNRFVQVELGLVPADINPKSCGLKESYLLEIFGENKKSSKQVLREAAKDAAKKEIEIEKNKIILESKQDISEEEIEELFSWEDKLEELNSRTDKIIEEIYKK